MCAYVNVFKVGMTAFERHRNVLCIGLMLSCHTCNVIITPLILTLI